MRYIVELLPVVPIVAVVSVLIYAIFYQLIRNRREKPSRFEMLYEYLLMAWFVMFVYVTQIKSFGNGMGELYNIRPLKSFYIAYRYGSNNGGMVWQFLLNIFMFLPFGFLLASVFRKWRSWRKILLVSFLTTLAAELLQLISRRGTDIDDVIANTVGGLCGYAIYLLFSGIVTVAKHTNSAIPKFRKEVITAISILFLTAIPFFCLNFTDKLSTYGNMYYGHLQPANIIIPDSISNEQLESKIYQYSSEIDLAEIQERLIMASNIQGDFTESNGKFQLLDTNKKIFIDEKGRWSVHLVDSKSTANPSLLPDIGTSVTLAWEYLNTFGITADMVAYEADISTEYGDGNRHLRFVSNETATDFVIDGAVSVTIGENGKLLTVSDQRIKCTYVESVFCISPRESIEIAKNVGVGEWNGTATVTWVEPIHVFIEETGYLIPAWKINADFVSASGQTYKWIPVIDAIK